MKIRKKNDHDKNSRVIFFFTLLDKMFFLCVQNFMFIQNATCSWLQRRIKLCTTNWGNCNLNYKLERTFRTM